MASAKNRVMVTIPTDLEEEIRKLKQSKYYDKPFAEMYRQILRSGLDCVQKENNKMDCHSNLSHTYK